MDRRLIFRPLGFVRWRDEGNDLRHLNGLMSLAWRIVFRQIRKTVFNDEFRRRREVSFGW